jgi:hypothetical protein
LGAKNECEVVPFGADVVTSTMLPYTFTEVTVKVSMEETVIVTGEFHTRAAHKL